MSQLNHISLRGNVPGCEIFLPDQKVRPAELARRLGTTPQAVNRLTNLRHPTKIDGIASAMKALGKTLEIRAA